MRVMRLNGWCVLFLVPALALVPAAATAGGTGKLAGKVKDEGGTPLASPNVGMEGERLGASYPLPWRGIYRAMAYTAYQDNSFSRDVYRGGVEWGYRDHLALRAGYGGSGDEDDLIGFSYGVELRVPPSDSKLYMDYAGQTVSDFFDDVRHVWPRFVS
jgi:hypothetical protein